MGKTESCGILKAYAESTRLVDLALKMPDKTKGEKDAFLDKLVDAIIPAGVVLTGNVSDGCLSEDKQKRDACKKLARKFNLELLKRINTRLEKRVSEIYLSQNLYDIKSGAEYKRVVARLVELWAASVALSEFATDETIVPDPRVRDAFDSWDSDLTDHFEVACDSLELSDFFEQFKETEYFKQFAGSVNCLPLFREADEA